VKPTAVRVSNSNSLISSNSCSQVALKPVLNSSTPSKPVSGEIVTLFVIRINRQQFLGQYFALLFESHMFTYSSAISIVASEVRHSVVFVLYFGFERKAF